STLKGVSPSGWVCLVARAVDKTQNVGVSAPMRLCLWDKQASATAPDCAVKSMPLPTCARSCTPPPHFKPHVTDVEPKPYVILPQ
ncbi:MAG TPA: hypothetical protein VH062_34625, partial [Polyangiaceae bacterium]|nr:hypothetical protein [Polyangiaceae bacterium]